MKQRHSFASRSSTHVHMNVSKQHSWTVHNNDSKQRMAQIQTIRQMKARNVDKSKCTTESRLLLRDRKRMRRLQKRERRWLPPSKCIQWYEGKEEIEKVLVTKSGQIHYKSNAVKSSTKIYTILWSG